MNPKFFLKKYVCKLIFVLLILNFIFLLYFLEHEIERQENFGASPFFFKMELKDCLQKIDFILEDYFQNQKKPQKEKEKTRETHHYHHHYHDNSYFWLFYPQSRPSIIVVDSNGQQGSKEKKDDSVYKVLATVSGVALSLLGTYVIAKDEYINYLMSNLDQEMSELKQICGKMSSRGEILDILETYRIWKSLYEVRTRPKLCAKATTIGSSFIGLGGLYMMSSSLMLGGVFGLTGSACFLLWKHLNNKPRSEENFFDDLKSRIKSALAKIQEQEQEPGSQPSAYNPSF